MSRSIARRSANLSAFFGIRVHQRPSMSDMSAVATPGRRPESAHPTSARAPGHSQDIGADGRILIVRNKHRERDERETTGIVLVENWFEEFRDPK